MRQKLPMEYLSLKDATTSYKVSDRTLRTAIAKLPTDERAKAVQSKGNKLFVSSEFLRARFELRAPPPKVKRAKANATPTDEPKPMPNTTPTDERATSNELIVASLQNEIANLHTRLQESSERQKELNYIIANLTKSIAPPPTDTPGPKPNTTTGEPFIWFIVGLVFGLFVVGLVIYSSY